jgi:tetratricopeptide (TPR) repeat protein
MNFVRAWMLVAALAGSAAAEDAVPAEMRRHFAEGTKAFNLGEFERAIVEYRAAYNLRPDPGMLYNIGQAYRLANDLPQALFFYRSYLHNLPNAANRAEVEERIRTIDEQLKAAKEVASKPPNTTEPPDPKVAPISVVAVPPPPPPVAPRVPVYKRWWLWTAVGVGVAAVAVGVGVGLGTRSPDVPMSALGSIKVFY